MIWEVYIILSVMFLGPGYLIFRHTDICIEKNDYPTKLDEIMLIAIAVGNWMVGKYDN